MFEPNLGQAPPDVQFLSRQTNYRIEVKRTSLVVASPDGELFDIRFLNTSPEAQVAGADLLPGRSNILKGPRSQWITNIPHYGAVEIRNLYPGVDVRVYVNGGEFEYDVLTQPGIDPGIVRISMSGARQRRLTPAGDLELVGDQARLTSRRPRVFQGIAEVACEYREFADGSIGFALGPYRHDAPLRIDPVLVYTYTGLAQHPYDGVAGLAVDAQGNAYTLGSTDRDAYPLVNPLQRFRLGQRDLVISKLDPTGKTLLFSTYLGSSESDGGSAIAVDAQGFVYIAGGIVGPDFPTTPNTLQPTSTLPYNHFLAKLTPDGSALVYSTFLDISPSEMAVDSQGNVYLSASTAKTKLPMVNPIQSETAGGSDAFVVKINPDATAVLFSTFLGGSKNDYAGGLAIAHDGAHIYVTGSTASNDFPLVRAARSAEGDLGDTNAFLVKLVDGQVFYSTYWGGHDDRGAAVTVDDRDNAFIVGNTNSAEFPTGSALEPTWYQFNDCFVAGFDPNGVPLFSTFVGNMNRCSTIALDTERRIVVAGTAGAGVEPTVDSLPGLVNSENGGPYLAVLSPDGSYIQMATFFASWMNMQSVKAVTGADSSIHLFSTSANGFYLAKLRDYAKCTFTVDPEIVEDLPAGGGSGVIHVNGPPGCSWRAVTKSPITVGTERFFFPYASGTGSGSFTYQVPYTDVPRRLTINAAGRRVTIYQRGFCNYSVDNDTYLIPKAGGTGTVKLTTSPGCKWTAESERLWVNLTSVTQGTGQAVLSFTVAANPYDQPRKAEFRIGGERITVHQAGVDTGATASFLKSDATTKGSWKGAYGADGHQIPGVGSSLPSYLSAAASGLTAHLWAASTSDSRGLEKPSGSGRVAPVWYAAAQILIDVPFSDAETHQVALYFLDWDNLGRVQAVDLLDTNGNVLDTRTISKFSGGVWLSWSVRGAVRIRVIRKTGLNAVVSGVFFGPGAVAPVSVSVSPGKVFLSPGQQQVFTATVTGSGDTSVTWQLNPVAGTIGTDGKYTAPATITAQQSVTIRATSNADSNQSATGQVILVPPAGAAASSARFVRFDATTQGTWVGTYGGDGSVAPADNGRSIAYVTPAVSGAQSHVWPTGGTLESRQLQRPSDPGSRYAPAWYAPTNFTVNLPVTDQVQHTLAVYCLDWDNLGRKQTVEVLGPNNEVLDTETVSDFAGGKWLVWTITGPVVLRVTRLSGPNAVISGVFLGGGTPSPRVYISPLTATVIAGYSQKFTAEVFHAAHGEVTWSIHPAVGTITRTGLYGDAMYVAPATVATEQNVTVTATSVAEPSKSASAVVTLKPAPPGGSVQFLRLDTLTRGNWKGLYGGDGYSIAGDVASLPSYVSPILTGAQSHTWSATPADERALQRASSNFRVAATLYATQSLTIELPFSDSSIRQVAVYCLDWDSLGRAQSLEVLDAAGNVLDRREIGSFPGGVYVVWNVSGTARIRVTRMAGPNSVISGLFFDTGGPPVSVTISPASVTLLPSETRQFTASVSGAENQAVVWSVASGPGSVDSTGLYTAPAIMPSFTSASVKATSVAYPNRSATAVVTLNAPADNSAAELVKVDTATRGSWKGVYGTEGYFAYLNGTQYPSNVLVSHHFGRDHLWNSDTNDPRALQQPGGSSRIAAALYSPERFLVEADFSDTEYHHLAVYCLDWDRLGRSQRLDIVDAHDRLLASHTVSSFGDGVWVVWKVRGHVKLRVDRLTQLNVVISGVFFDPAVRTGPFITEDRATKGTWYGVYGSEGQFLAGQTGVGPSYLASAPAGSHTHVWAASTTDGRALLKIGSTTERIAGTWYHSVQITLDLPFTDTQPHRVALYCLDWDGGGRVQDVELLDGTGQVMDRRTVDNFAGGVWLVWEAPGPAKIRITRKSGQNAVASGIFLGPA